MPTLTDTQLHALARLGAIARLKELEDEAAAIRRAFPGLTKAATPSNSPAPGAPGKRKKRTRNVSPEVRRAAAERMKAYWAKRKGEKAETGGATEVSAKAEENAPQAPAAPARAKRRTIGKSPKAPSPRRAKPTKRG